jgi:hypothetical protein
MESANEFIAHVWLKRSGAATVKMAGQIRLLMK